MAQPLTPPLLFDYYIILSQKSQDLVLLTFYLAYSYSKLNKGITKVGFAGLFMSAEEQLNKGVSKNERRINLCL
ncbi:MAG: hypothetical protein FWF76_07930 [Oscillospiraceae bacterium]|nr:hypothetical protein [Oscillospiraceae bacterium]